MIDASFVKSVADLAQSVNNVQLVTTDKLPNMVGVRTAAGVEWKPSPAPTRHHTIRSFADLVAIAKDVKVAREPEVYHSHDQVVVILDRDGRREAVKMPLERTDRFASLLRLTKPGGRSFGPAEAVKFIRFELHGVGADALCAAIRKLDFTRKSNGERTVEHGRESLGRSVEAAVQAPQQVPEEFIAEVPIWSVSGLRNIKAKVRVGVYLDVNDESIELVPLADEISGALEAAQGELHARLATELNPIPVYQGEVGLTG